MDNTYLSRSPEAVRGKLAHVDNMTTVAKDYASIERSSPTDKFDTLVEPSNYAEGLIR